MLKSLMESLRWAQDPEHKQRVALLARTPLFAGLRKRLLGRLATRLFVKTYQPGEAIFSQGDPGRALFVVEEGSVEVVRTSARGTQRLAVIKDDSAFGEMALVDELPRSATARALTPTRLLILYRSHFDELMEGDPVVALAICRNLLRTLARYVRTRQIAPMSDAEPADAMASPSNSSEV